MKIKFTTKPEPKKGDWVILSESNPAWNQSFYKVNGKTKAFKFISHQFISHRLTDHTAKIGTIYVEWDGQEGSLCYGSPLKDIFVVPPDRPDLYVYALKSD